MTFSELTPWNESSDRGVKYFSGTAAYAKTLQAPDEWFEGGSELWLDLGRVKNLAEVLVNGEPLGIVWTEPFRVNVSQVSRPGENRRWG
jgi:(4-O-methyl)-D-glucuronate---lignin esterase